MSIDRRDFLKAALAGGTLLAAGGEAQAREDLKQPDEAMGLLYDSTLCIGCKACVAACKESNGLPPEYSTTEQYWDTPLDLSGKTKNVIKMYKSGSGENKDKEENGYAFMKMSCNHCNDPSCVSACPVSAMTKDPKTGVVGYDEKACIGCRYCVAACPFGVPRFQYDTPFPKIVKCELCRHLKPGDKFEYSACAQSCPTGATIFGRSKDLLAEAKRRLALKPGTTTVYPRGKLGGVNQDYEGTVGNYQQHVYGEKEYGGTQVYKIAALPLEKLGLVKLPEHSSAATSETMQHTLYGGLIMPLAVLGGLVYVAKRNVKEEAGGDENVENQDVI